jgi:truncated hemoglobin YjbI
MVAHERDTLSVDPPRIVDPFYSRVLLDEMLKNFHVNYRCQQVYVFFEFISWNF